MPLSDYESSSRQHFPLPLSPTPIVIVYAPTLPWRCDRSSMNNVIFDEQAYLKQPQRALARGLPHTLTPFTFLMPCSSPPLLLKCLMEIRVRSRLVCAICGLERLGQLLFAAKEY
jgi:hypothetical protein